MTWLEDTALMDSDDSVVIEETCPRCLHVWRETSLARDRVTPTSASCWCSSRTRTPVGLSAECRDLCRGTLTASHF